MEELKVVQHPLLTRCEDRGTSSTLSFGLLLHLAIHGAHALHPHMEHRGIKPPHLHGSSLVSNQLVLLGLVTVDGAALVVEARVVTAPIRQILFLGLIQHLADGGLLPPAGQILLSIIKIILLVRILWWV